MTITTHWTNDTTDWTTALARLITALTHIDGLRIIVTRAVMAFQTATANAVTACHTAFAAAANPVPTAENAWITEPHQDVDPPAAPPTPPPSPTVRNVVTNVIAKVIATDRQSTSP